MGNRNGGMYSKSVTKRAALRLGEAMIHQWTTRSATMFHCAFAANMIMARVIPLTHARATVALAAAAPRVTPSGVLADARGRSLRDLRISVTDRCNFRCVYCMPKEA